MLVSARPTARSRLMLTSLLATDEERQYPAIRSPAEPELTGRVHYRAQKRLFRKPLVVLQVEVIHGADDHDRDGNCLAGQRYWMDAKIEPKNEIDRHI